MANLQLKVRRSAAVKTHYHDWKKAFSLCRQPVHMSVAVLDRFWWHTKAYATILSIAPLVLGSLVFLYLYWLCRKFLQVSAKNAVKNSD